jgi:hypothetical protein
MIKENCRPTDLWTVQRRRDLGPGARRHQAAQERQPFGRRGLPIFRSVGQDRQLSEHPDLAMGGVGPALAVGGTVVPTRRLDRGCKADNHARGAAGVSLFNFVYYREEDERYFLGDRGPFNEPPFGVLEKLRHPPALAQNPQHWFATPEWKWPWGRLPLEMPQKVMPGKNMTLTLDLAGPDGGWRKDGKMRIQSYVDLRGSSWAARLNDQPLAETVNRAEPYPNPYPPMLGRSFELRAWLVPAHLLREGTNKVEIDLIQANEGLMEKSGYEIPYFDLAMPTSGELCPWVIT